MNLPIRVRLTLWYALLLATIIAGLSSYLVLQLRGDLRESLDEAVRVAAVTIIDTVADDNTDADPSEPPDPEDAVEDARDFMDVAAAVLPAAGGAQVLVDDHEALLAYGSVAALEGVMSGRSQTALARAGRTAFVTRELGDDDQAYRILVTPYQDRGEERLLVLAFSLEPVQNAVRQVLFLLLIAGPVALAATALAAYWLARQAMRPVERMTSDAEVIGASQLDERIAVPSGRDEIRRLAVTLNAMLARIEHGVRDKQQLVADASHELRTPLAVMRAELDVSLRNDDLPDAARDVLTSAREEVDRVGRTVDNLLTMAAADEGRLELLTTQVDLRVAVEHAAEPLRQLAAANEVTLLVEGDPCPAQADPHRLGLAVTNVIENAIKFSPLGGTVRVSTWRHEGEVGITVEDEGPGVPLDDREHLFDRYYRVEDGRPHRLGGSGLGLAIAREVTTAHGGRLWVEGVEGAGSSFSIALPRWRSLDPAGVGEPDPGPGRSGDLRGRDRVDAARTGPPAPRVGS